jgi:UDP-glucuronate 4-epimerase
VSRYLITGCAGFIGSHLTEALLRRGDEVVGVDAFTDYYPRPAKESNLEGVREDANLSLVELDLSTAALEPLLAGVDGVFHLAAQPGVRGSFGDTFADYVRDNIIVTQRLFESVAAKGLRVVMASTSSVYGNAETYPTREDATPRPVSPYGVTKLACEALARTYGECFGLEAVLLRYFTVYGPRQRPDMAFARVIDALLTERRFTVYGTGEQSRDFTHIDNVVAANLLAMDAPDAAGHVLNIACGTSHSLNDIVDVLNRLLGTDIEAVHAAPRPGDVARSWADISLAEEVLGYVPAVDLERGLRLTIEAFEDAERLAAIDSGHG